MRVVAFLPTFGTENGAFVTGREVVFGLVDAGHEVAVVTTWQNRPSWVERGVRVTSRHRWQHHGEALAAPEVSLSNHGDTSTPVPAIPGVPHVLMVHGETDRPIPDAAAAVWFPSWATAEFYGMAEDPRTVVIAPPIDVDAVRATPGERVTLNGSTVAKGADVLAEVARRLPRVPFTCVRGGVPHVRDVRILRNVHFVSRMEPARLYAQTRVLLMPSTHETWGRVGLEAMLSGIPVVAAPLPGIREALGDAALYVDRDDLDEWAGVVDDLMNDPAEWAAASARALDHAATYNLADVLGDFDDLFRTIATREGTPV